MTEQVVDNQTPQPQTSDKELNFRKQEAMYQRMLDERERRIKELEQQASRNINPKIEDDDEDDAEPYVGHKKLNKKLAKVGESTQSEIQKAMEMAKQSAKEELKQEIWLENNPDFFDILKLADKFAAKAPKLAENILKMPDNFERQKLVYHNIKELGIDKPEQKQSSVQDKIDANRRSPYYQPSSVGSAPYNATAGDFSQSGQKSAYDKMQELKNRLSIG